MCKGKIIIWKLSKSCGKISNSGTAYQKRMESELPCGYEKGRKRHWYGRKESKDCCGQYL